MSNNNGISYLNRTFDDYKESLREYIGQYYPQIASDMNDASIGSWLVDMVAAVADNLSYYIDKAYSETNLETASQRNSVYAIARSNGLRVPGPKGSVALCDFSCELPVKGPNTMPDYTYAPILKKGTKVASRDQSFEVMNEINFAEQFDHNGYSNRSVVPVMDANGRIIKYRVTKKEVVTAGESKIYKQVISNPNDIHPFMEIVIPDTNVMNVESIIFKEGVDFQQDPYISDFMTENEVTDIGGKKTYRFFEVDSLSDSVRWGDEIDPEKQDYSIPVRYEYTNDEGQTVYSVTKGEWKPVMQKFITEFTDNGYLKVIFGSGEQVGTEYNDIDRDSFAAYQISRMVKNNFLGKLPKVGTTMYILYRVGGGASSNVPAGAINRVQYLNAVMNNEACDTGVAGFVRKSISVSNPHPSVTGKDAPTVDEVRAMIKYNNSAQNRCVTVKDYENRIMLIPPRYGCPFRVSVTEENNKVMVYMLGINADGTLSDVLPQQLIANIAEYLSKYRSINDFVEMKPGKIVNISVEADLYIDRNYSAMDVISEAIDTIKDFFDINKHRLGETIYLSMLMKRLSNVSGVLNLMDLRIFNEFNPDMYSMTRSIDPIVNPDNSEFISDGEGDEMRSLIDTDATKYLLNCDVDAMFEIKNPNIDIRIRSMVR